MTDGIIERLCDVRGTLRTDCARGCILSANASAAMCAALEEAIDLLTPRVLRPEEYDTWTGDAWAEDFDSGVVTAIDRSAVKAYGKYVRFDRDGAKRLWTGRPSEEQRKAVPWNG